MKQIKIDGLGVQELTDVELVNTDGGSLISDLLTTFLDFAAKFLNPLIGSIFNFMMRKS